MQDFMQNIFTTDGLRSAIIMFAAGWISCLLAERTTKKLALKKAQKTKQDASEVQA